jgi:hypothetical protein
MSIATMKKFLCFGMILAAVALTACQSPGGWQGGGGASWFGSGLSSPALEKQRSFMAKSFAGTGVSVEVVSKQAFKVTVPAKFSFDAGHYAVKPQLAKVMELLTPGVARNPAAVLQMRIAPDAKAASGLQAERRSSLRDMAVANGLPLSRVQVSTDSALDNQTELTVIEM